MVFDIRLHKVKFKTILVLTLVVLMFFLSSCDQQPLAGKAAAYGTTCTLNSECDSNVCYEGSCVYALTECLPGSGWKLGRTYVLTQDIEQDIDNGDFCFNIDADNVVLDCQHHTITNTKTKSSGSHIISGIGVYSENDGVIIKNCGLKRFSEGITLENNINGLLSANYITDTNNGITLRASAQTLVEKNKVEKSLVAGIHLANTIQNRNIVLADNVVCGDEGLSLSCGSFVPLPTSSGNVFKTSGVEPCSLDRTVSYEACNCISDTGCSSSEVCHAGTCQEIKLNYLKINDDQLDPETTEYSTQNDEVTIRTGVSDSTLPVTISDDTSLFRNLGGGKKIFPVQPGENIFTIGLGYPIDSHYTEYELKVTKLVDNDLDSFYSDVDCDDTDSTVYPGADELCDGQINNCDTTVLPVDEIDNDNDNYVECTFDTGGWDGDSSIVGGNDCDDGDDAKFPAKGGSCYPYCTIDSECQAEEQCISGQCQSGLELSRCTNSWVSGPDQNDLTLYVLKKDIEVSNNDDCMIFQGTPGYPSNHIILDCQSHKVIGQGEGKAFSFKSASTNIEIRNCEISNFQNAFFTENTLSGGDIKLNSNYIHDNNIGVSSDTNPDNSPKVSLINNVISSNERGIIIGDGSRDTLVFRNVVCNNNRFDFICYTGTSRVSGTDNSIDIIERQCGATEYPTSSDYTSCPLTCTRDDECGVNLICNEYGFCINSNTICGDQVKEGREQCDDGNTNDNDGCSSACQYETNTLIETENMVLNDLVVTTDYEGVSSVVHISVPGGDSGSATYTIGVNGMYDIVTKYFDENDGAGAIEILLDGTSIDSKVLNLNDNEWHEFTIQGVTLAEGQLLTLKLKKDNNEFIRVDNINLIPQPICGDGNLEGNEVCEQGNQQSCGVNGYSGTETCKSDCTGYENCQTTELCGDQIINGPEECDEGNTNDNDGCSSTCEVEDGWSCTSVYDSAGNEYSECTEDVTYVLGDVDCQNGVGISDAFKVKRYFLDSTSNPFDASCTNAILAADVDCQNGIGISDAFKIKRYFLDSATNPFVGCS